MLILYVCLCLIRGLAGGKYSVHTTSLCDLQHDPQNELCCRSRGERLALCLSCVSAKQHFMWKKSNVSIKEEILVTCG